MTEIKQKWWKQGIEGGTGGCLCCPATVSKLPMTTRLYQGFGGWSIKKDGVHIYSGESGKKFNEYPTLLKFENQARKEPNIEWIAQVDLPLRSGVYQRHGKNSWVLIEKGNGFA